MAKEKLVFTALTMKEASGLYDFIVGIDPAMDPNLETGKDGKMQISVEMEPQQKHQLEVSLSDAGYAIVGNRLVSTIPLEREEPTKPEQATFEQARESVGKLFEDKRVATTAEFGGKGKKEAGVSEGYVAKRTTDDKTHMIKQAFKTPEDLERMQQRDKMLFRGSDQDTFRNVDLLTEYVMGPLYQRVLYDRAPVIEMVLEAGEDKTKIGTEELSVTQGKNIYIRSKFLDNFQMLGHYTGNEDPSGSQVNRDEVAKAKVADIQGFEKVIASCLMMGELDYHAGNIGVVTTKGEDGKDVHTAVKIDHGRSDLAYRDEASLVTKFMEDYKDFGYAELGMPFDPAKFKEAIDQMTKVSHEEIERTIKVRADQLEAQGFKFQRLNADLQIENSTKDRFVGDTVRRISRNIGVMEDLSKSLGELAREDMPDVLKKDFFAAVDAAKSAKCNTIKEWTDKGAHISWAIDNNKKINGQDPLKYAVEKNIGIFNTDPLMSASYRVDGLLKHCNDKGRDSDSGMKSLKIIDNILTSMAENDYKMRGGKDPIIFAVENNLTIKGKDPILYALENNKSIPKDCLVDNPEALLESYTRAKESGNQAVMEQLHKVHNDLFNPTFTPSHDVGQLVCSGKYELVAQMLDKANKEAPETVKPAPTANDLLKSCSLEVLYHAAKVGEVIESREAKQGAGQAIQDKLRSFGNAVKNLFGKGVDKGTIERAQDDFSKVKPEVAKDTKEAQTQTHKALGKFTSKVMQERGGPGHGQGV